jgi:hypothetical protein
MFTKRLRGRICDMSGLEYVPAEGLRDLVLLHRIEPFRLVNVGPELLAQLELTRLVVVFEIEGYTSHPTYVTPWNREECQMCHAIAGVLTALLAMFGMLSVLQGAGVVGL